MTLPRLSTQQKDWTVRAIKTFTQGFTAILMGSGTGLINVETWKAAVIAGGASLLSLIHNWAASASASVQVELNGGKK